MCSEVHISKLNCHRRGAWMYGTLGEMIVESSYRLRSRTMQNGMTDWATSPPPPLIAPIWQRCEQCPLADTHSQCKYFSEWMLLVMHTDTYTLHTMLSSFCLFIMELTLTLPLDKALFVCVYEFPFNGIQQTWPKWQINRRKNHHFYCCFVWRHFFLFVRHLFVWNAEEKQIAVI